MLFLLVLILQYVRNGQLFIFFKKLARSPRLARKTRPSQKFLCICRLLIFVLPLEKYTTNIVPRLYNISGKTLKFPKVPVARARLNHSSKDQQNCKSKIQVQHAPALGYSDLQVVSWILQQQLHRWYGMRFLYFDLKAC